MNTFQIKDINLSFLTEHCADLVASIGVSAVDSAREGLMAEGKTEGEAVGMAAGIAQETQRIQDVEASLISGHEALIQTLKFDGTTTGPEAAVKVIQAEKSGAGQTLKDIESDSPKPADTVSVDAAIDTADEDANLTVEERAKKNWDAKADLRAEYGTIERYESFLKHSPDIRVKTDR